MKGRARADERHQRANDAPMSTTLGRHRLHDQDLSQLTGRAERLVVGIDGAKGERIAVSRPESQHRQGADPAALEQPAGDLVESRPVVEPAQTTLVARAGEKRPRLLAVVSDEVFL
jgi:hypothetical protein